MDRKAGPHPPYSAVVRDPHQVSQTATRTKPGSTSGRRNVMVRRKHVKSPGTQPTVVESGDRVVATNGHMNGEEPLNGHALEEETEPRGVHVMMKGTVNRRKVLGLAAAGVAGGSVLVEGFSSPALAATTTEPGAVAPAVVALTDAPTIVVDASLGNDFRVTIAASRTMGNPSNATDGQKIVFQVTQGGAGSCTITWGSLYEFSSGLPQPTLSTTVGQTDLLAFIYNAALGKWLFVAFVGQFYPAPTVSKVSPSSGPTTGGPPSPSPGAASPERPAWHSGGSRPRTSPWSRAHRSAWSPLHKRRACTTSP